MLLTDKQGKYNQKIFEHHNHNLEIMMVEKVNKESSFHRNETFSFIHSFIFV